jgi:type VI protein secretion system component Hcp
VTIGGGGSGAGKTSISSLNIMKYFDACSPVLFDAVNRGTAFNQLTLVQRDTNGDPVATVVLENVRVESWQLSSSIAEAGPTESVSFAAQKFCVADVPSGNKFCYDVLTAK